MKGQIKYERQLQNTYIILDTVAEAVVEAYSGQIVLRNNIEKFAVCKIVSIDGKQLMQYDISNCQDITTVYSAKTLNYADVISIVSSLNLIIKDMESFLMDGLQLVLSPEYIYLDLETKKVKFLFDFSESRVHSDIDKLGEFLIDRVNHEDKAATSLAYYFFEHSQNGNYSVTKMEEYIEECEKEEQNQQKEKTIYDSDIFGSQESHNERDEVEDDLIVQVNRDDALDYLYGDTKYIEEVDNKECKNILQRILSILNPTDNKCKEKRVGRKTKKSSLKRITGEKNKPQKEPRFEYYDENYNKESANQFDNDNENTQHTVYIGKSAREREYVLVELRRNKEIIHKIENYPFVLGTQKDSVNLYVKDLSVSRIHAKIIKYDDVIYIEDMHSTNGTMINDIPLMPHEKNRIKRGDIITLGKTEFEFR